MSCPKCGAENREGAKFCDACGAFIATVSESPAPTAASAVDERRIVTALFADIKGSTELMRDLDPEEARAIIDPALRLMIDAIHRYDGYVVQSTGDGIFALFGAPVAHEDHPQRATHAALRIQEELRRYSAKVVEDGGIPIKGRVGLNTGEVVMRMVQTGGHTEYSPVGHAINLAQRMESVAPSETIVVSEETRRLVEGYFELRAMGPTEIKGIAEPIEVYQVVGVGALHGHFDLAARRGLTRFVGRETELAQMRRALELAIDGHGQLVAVMAEAGTGKSRLFHEFKATIPTSCKVLEAYSVSHGKASAWLPALELLHGYFGIQDSDDASSRREKVQAVLGSLDPALNDTLPYLFGLLGIVEAPDPLAQMDANIKRQRTLDAIKRIFIRESLNQPLVVIFEDLHWIDLQTQALLDLLADSLANARILLLVNYRPEYRHEWTNKGCYSQLRLDPLAGAYGAAMLAALLGESVELNPLKRLIAERTGGNPFFIEEIVQGLFDEGALVRNGIVKVTRSLSQLRLPPTVQGILAARIDRQPAEHKTLLQSLAVIGRESSLGLIQHVATKPQLERMLADLQAAEFIYVQPSGGGVEYVFKHALTQEVAYNSLLIERRKQIHERVGAVLESMFAEQLDDHLSQLAHHYRHSNNVSKGVEYLGRAGQQAIQRSAHGEAVVNLNAALELLERIPENTERIQKELFLQIALGQALLPVKGFSAPEVERAFVRARDLCKQLGDPPGLSFVLAGLRGVYFIRGKYRLASELDQQFLRRAESAQDPSLLSSAHWIIGITWFQIGEMLRAREHLEMSFSLYDRERDRPRALLIGADPGSTSLAYLGMTLWTLGYPDQALKKGIEGVALGQGLAHPNCGNQFFLAAVHQYRREAEEVQRAAENAIAVAAEHGFTAWLSIATILLRWAMIDQGQGHDAENISQLREGLAAFRATEAQVGRPYHLWVLADACLKTNRLGEGLDALKEALAVADENEEHNWDAEIHRLRGELLLRKEDSNVENAQRCFEQAIEIARKQSTKSFELRASISLYQLLASQGRRNEARAKLADIYKWFTEGFDTADLKDAKALLNDLGT